MQNRQSKRRRLARTCLGGTHDILPSHDVRQSLCLNRSGRCIASVDNCLEQGWMQTDFGEGGSDRCRRFWSLDV